MPLFDFTCRGCGETSELLVRGSAAPRCPSCGGEDLEKQLALSAVKSDTTRGLALRAAKKRDRAQGRDRMYDQLHYEQSHDRHGD